MEVIENKDSSDFDICQVTQKTLRELHKICQFIPYAEGFNSAGWIKYHIRHNNLNQTNSSKLYVVRRPPEKMAAKSPLPKTFCINLERRPDRKDVMIERFNKANLDVEFVKAVDGRELAWTEELKHLFRNNTYGSHRGVIGCALSHYNLWRQLTNSNDDSYLIFEDDVTLADNFKEKLSHAYAQVENNDFDILYLTFTIYNNKLETMKDVMRSNNFPKVIPFDTSFYGAGNIGYIISKSGAKKLLQYVEQNGFNVPCDSIARIMPSVSRFSTIPHICTTPYVGPFSDHKDSDTQIDNKQPTVNVCTVENYHNGQPARFETYENGHISKLIRKGQVWEPHLHRVFERYIKPDDVVIEAGCHIGTHTIKLSKLSNKVYAFEPLPSSHSILSTNLQLNKCTNVSLINKGVSNKPGTTKFGWVPDDNPGGAGLDDNPMGAPNWVTSPKKDIAVELTTIDSLNLEKLDFMKIDVEGYELRVIEGAINTIKKCRPTIVLECWSNHSGGVSLEHTSSLFKILLDIGYNIAHIQGPDFIFLP